MDKQQSFLIVDGSAYLYRAYHALPPLTTRTGQPTGAIYGVVNMLRKTIANLQPDYLAVVFDPRGQTTRHAYYPEYKANRAAMPDELRTQIEPLHKIIRAMGIPLIIEPGIEADDVIGSLAKQVDGQGVKTIISSGDKDFAQLVTPSVELVNTMNGTVLDRSGVIEKFGMPPERIIDYLALVGDASDNVPGVPKVGPKTAVKWLNQYGNLDKLIANAHQIGGKVGENLRANLDTLALARRLVTIDCDLQLTHSLSDCRRTSQDQTALRHWFQALEFTSWLAELATADAGDGQSEAVQTQQVEYECVVTETALEAWVERLRAAKVFALDTETTSIDPMQAKLVGVSFAVEAGKAAYVPIAHDDPGPDGQLAQTVVLDALRPLLTDPTCCVIGQNFKYDYKVLARHGLVCTAGLEDTLLLSYMLTGSGRHDMDALSLRYLGVKPISFTDVAGQGTKQLTFNQVDLEVATAYAAEDADLTLRLFQTLKPQLEQISAQHKLYTEMEVPLLSVLARMEATGVCVDVQLLAKQSASLAERLAVIQDEAFTQAGCEFNLSSPKQLQEILFDQLRLPVLKKTPTKQPSTSESVLAQLAGRHPLPKLILDYRQLAKLRSTYTEALQAQCHPETGRVHCSYHQAVTSTGRLSSSDPNLQNIPIRRAEGRQIRQAFVAPAGHQILAADYSQIELRIMAHLSGDAGLKNAFAQGLDIHTATAAELFGIPLDQVGVDQRRDAKAINFGLIYGMSAFGLAQQLEIGRAEAQRYIDVYFARYPGVKAYMDSVVAQARSRGYVETLMGRRLVLPTIHDRNVAVRRAAERTAINAPMQGTAADMIKLAMLSIDAWLQAEYSEVKMTMQVHDELVFEVPNRLLDTISEQVKFKMETAYQLDVPIVVDIGTGPNWGAAHE